MERTFDNVFEATLVVKGSSKVLTNDILLIEHIKKSAKAGKMTLKNLNVDYLHAHSGNRKIPSYSIVLIVEESHIAIYTYPEKNTAHINIATCSSQKSLNAIIKYFKKVFEVKSENDMKIINI